MSLDDVVWGNTIQSWLIALAIIVGALILGRVISMLMRGLGKRTKWEIAGFIADNIGAPVMVFVMLFGFRVAFESLTMKADTHDLLTKATTFCVGIILTWLIVRAYDAVHRGIFVPYAKKPDTQIDLHVLSVLQSIMAVVIWTLGFASALASIGFEVTAVLASLGVGGVALALASQDTVSNFFGGLIVLTQHPFKVGDRISVAGVDGWVQHIGFRTTVIKNWWGQDITIPNTQFTNQVLINIDSQGQYFKELRPRLDPGTSVEKLEEALQIFRDIVKDNQDVLDAITWEAVAELGPGYIELEFWFAVTRWRPEESERFDEYAKQALSMTKVNLELIRRYQAAGIKFAVPTNIHWNVEVERGNGPTRLQPPPPLRSLPS